jgi:hypothetical protein
MTTTADEQGCWGTAAGGRAGLPPQLPSEATCGEGAEGDRAEGSEADTRNTLIGTENVRKDVYPSQGATSRDVAANRSPQGRWVAADETQRFLAKVNTAGDCWLWTGGTDRDGYGRFQARRPGRWVYVRAHRWAYETRYGPIPGGLTLDHTCHTTDPGCAGGPACPHRRCVRPDHLEAVTFAENRRRAHNRRPNARKDQS